METTQIRKQRVEVVEDKTTRKYKTKIPKELVAKHGLKLGDKLSYVIMPDGSLLLSVNPKVKLSDNHVDVVSGSS